MSEKISVSKSFQKHLIINTLLLFVIAGCSSASPTPISLTPTLTSVPVISATIQPPTSSPTSTPTCPQIASNIKFIPPETNNDIANTILNFLNSGGDPDEINSYYSQFQSKTLDILAADLNEDGLNEIIVAGALPLELNSPGEGVIYIFGCKQASYEIEKQFDSQNLSSAKILRTENLLVDYPQQVFIQYRPIAGWASYILAIGYLKGDWQIVFESSDLFPELVVFDQDNDGNKEISIHSITTATQGPQRLMISAFKWDGEQYTLISNQLMSGTTRIEYLDDAQRALDQGDVSMAIAYYDRAAHDSNLGNFASRDEVANQQVNLAGNYQISFALFRLYTLWSSVHAFDKASSTIEELEEQFLVNMPGNEFLQAAKIFEQNTVQGKSPKEACTAVASFLTQNYPDLNIHIGDWGASVVWYAQINELCLFR